MSRRMLKEEAQAWMAGWNALREREREELLSESYEDKFRALALLMASVDLFDLSPLEAEDVAARARWARLQSIGG
ncbi:MAG: hypothetical protein ACXW2Q_04380 [Thermoanaerobaculia bacterium]